MPRLKVFVSSVQKELAGERMAVSVLLSTDSFLQKHTVPRLFEYDPAPLVPADKAYLDLLRSCNLCVLIVGSTYGTAGADTGLSATHEEYRIVQELRLPLLVCVKGDDAVKRDNRVKAFLREIRKEKHTYSRFGSLEELERVVRERVVAHVKRVYDVSPTVDEERNAEQNMLSADVFERQCLDRAQWSTLNREAAARMIAAAEETTPDRLKSDEVRDHLLDRGYLWHDTDTGTYHATAAGLLLLSSDPSKRFSHARVQADAYAGSTRTPKADDHTFLKGPVTRVLDDAVQFVRRNTRHPLRVVGLTRVSVDEYPETALREVLVNAVVHRDYREAGRKVVLEVFHDRIMITNPGLPAGGQKLTRIASGRGRSRSRNPLLAQGLTWLEAMEDRGTGIMRMISAMLDHGLDSPVFSTDEGCVVVTLPGPGDDLDRIRVQADRSLGITPAQREAINDRQEKILEHAVEEGFVTTAWCVEHLGVVKDTVRRDFAVLVRMDLLQQVGKGRSTRYVPSGKEGGRAS